MTANLTNIYKKISLAKFKLLSIILCFLADVVFYIFAKTYLITPSSILSLMNSKPQFQALSQLEKNQWVDFMINQVTNMIIIYFALNFIAYIFFYLEKKWAINYVSKGTALLGIIFSVITIYEAAQFSIVWAIILASLIPLYIFVWKGCKHFFKTPNS